ncbi:MAG: hypothetical protein ACRDTE_23345 [Pseudonocardiaceae bacterium]
MIVFLTCATPGFVLSVPAPDTVALPPSRLIVVGVCCSCRRPGAMVGRRRRRCRVYPVAQYWLHQPGTALLVSNLAAELGLSFPPAPSSAPVAGSGLDRPGVTVTRREQPTDRGVPADLVEVLPRVAADPESAPITAQSPVVSPSASLPGGFPGAGRPVVDHSGTGERPVKDCSYTTR